MSDPRCGTYAGYERHRRAGDPACDPCRAAKADYTREWRAGHVAPRVLFDLTPEQLDAIRDMTHDRMTARDIAARLGIHKDAVHKGRSILGVIGYNPTSPDALEVDEAAVLRATWGETIELTHAERTEAVRRMNAQGMTAAQIARMLHVTRRTVERHVAKVRAAA